MGKRKEWWQLGGVAVLACGLSHEEETGGVSRQALQRLTVSAPLVLRPAAPMAVAAHASIACVDAECAAFYQTSYGSVCRIGGVRLSADGQPLEASRRDFGRTSDSCLGAQALAAGGDIAVSFDDPDGARAKVLLLSPSDLELRADLSATELGTVRGKLHTDGGTLLAVQEASPYRWSAVNYRLGSSSMPKRVSVPISFPEVIAGDGQYLFYDSTGQYQRFSAASSEWLGALERLAPDFELGDSAGYFHGGVYQLAWSPAGAGSPSIYGARITEAGELLDAGTDDAVTPQLLCEACEGSFGDVFQDGSSAYFVIDGVAETSFLLQIEVASGARARPELAGPDVALPTAPRVHSVYPKHSPRFAVAEGEIYALEPAQPATLALGEPHLPAIASTVTPANVDVASDGESFLVSWLEGSRLRARFVKYSRAADTAPELIALEASMPEVIDYDIDSVGDRYLISSLVATAEGTVNVVRRTVTRDGELGPLLTEPTTFTLSDSQRVELVLGSNQEYYLQAFLHRNLKEPDSTLGLQLLQADGTASGPPKTLTSKAKYLRSIAANRAEAKASRVFGLSYWSKITPPAHSLLRVQATSGEVLDDTDLQFQYPLAEDGEAVLLSSPFELLRLRDGARTALSVDGVAGTTVREWDGTSFVASRTSPSGAMRLTAFDHELQNGSEVRPITEQLVSVAASGTDRAGRSLVAYYSSDGDGRLLELRAVVSHTVSEDTGGGGAAGASNQAGASGETGADSASGGRPASPSGGDQAGSEEDQGVDPRAPRLSKGCGCAVPPHDPPTSLGVAFIAMMAAIGGLRSRRWHRKMAAQLTSFLTRPALERTSTFAGLNPNEEKRRGPD